MVFFAGFLQNSASLVGLPLNFSLMHKQARRLSLKIPPQITVFAPPQTRNVPF